MSVPSSPNIFKPQLSETNKITSDIYASDGEIWLAYASRLKFKDNENLVALNVTRDDILTSSEESIFVTNLSLDLEKAIQDSEVGKSVIGSVLTKIVNSEAENEENKESKLIVLTSGSYIINR